MTAVASRFIDIEEISLEEKQALSELLVPLPCDEINRLRTLRQCKLFDTLPEDSYDRYVSLCARHFKVPVV